MEAPNAINLRDASGPNPTKGKQAIVVGLLEGMIQGRWRGGDRLTEARAAEEFGLSRTPIREAFLELEGLRLLELRRNCGAVLLSFGPEEIREIYAVRMLLEVEATRLAAGRIPPARVESLIRDFEGIRCSSGVDPDWRHDRELHEEIAHSSGNRRLAAEIERYGNLVQSIRMIVARQVDGIHSPSAEEHLAILASLANKDPDGSAKAMRQHLVQASSTAIDAVRQIQSETC